MKQLLIKLNACNEAMEWAGDKTWEEIYRTCHRGDWLLWLFKQTNPNDLRLLTLAKGHCANTVRHLMKDERSIKAVDAAIAYGEGRIDIEELNNAATTADAYAAADAAAYAAYATDAYADAYAAAAAAAYATDAAADAADAYADAYVAADAAAYAAAFAARKKSQQETAEICRKYIPLDLILAAIKSQEKQKDGI